MSGPNSSPNSPASPPFSPPRSQSPESQQTSASSPQSDNPDQQALKYTVASHSVRITKHGYAIDPADLRYPEVANNLTLGARRASDQSFDSGQVAHQILALIRGFWSQPAYPKGRLVGRTDKRTSIDSILAEFAQYPTYPHRDTFGSIAKERLQKRGTKRGLRSRAHLTKVRLHKEHPPHTNDHSQSSSSSASDSGQFYDDILTRSITEKFATLSPPTSTPRTTSSTPHSSAPSSPSVAGGKKDDSSGSASSLLSLFMSQKNAPTRSPQLAGANSYHSWLPQDKEEIGELVLGMLKQMEKVFSAESRIVYVSSPCIVLGDIHGNLTDLRTYERSLWPKAPICVTSNYLFLGDYVDRGEYSVECVLYLFAMKHISPKRFYLLRGNHEVATIQKQYTFARECEMKFGSMGKQIWKSFNRVFDLMPLAAVIDEQIFCAHGGIPRSISDIRQLAREIPSPLDNPEVQCPSAWEILWNDPITDSELIGMIEMDNAVVTQTQITQTQPTPDGTELITTTSGTTSIASETAAKNAPNSSAEQQQQEALNEADSILTREPSVALSFYIKPDDQDQHQGSKPLSAAAKEAARESNDGGGNTLRSVPSDTSSIASASPAQMVNDGFVANIKRGTAYLFSDQAIKNFLRLNKFSHVIRAHEVIPTGFAFHGDGHVITIFSSSKYCGLNNQAACAMVDHERIRILRLDTGDGGE